MLSLCVIPRGISHCLKQSSQKLHVSVKVLAAKKPEDSSSSSSDDSSDSDSDKEKKNEVFQKIDGQTRIENNDTPNISDTNERLNRLLQTIAVSAKSKDDSKSINIKNKEFMVTKTIKVAINPKQVRFKNEKKGPVKKEPLEKQLQSAAKDVAQALKGDQKQIELDLLSKVLNLEEPSKNKDDSNTEETSTEAPMNLSGILSNMKIDQSVPESVSLEKRKMYGSKITSFRSRQPSLAESLLYEKSKNETRMKTQAGPELKVPHGDLGIFKNMSEKQITDIPKLSTWEAMEKREIKLSTMSTPENVFQELIQWTEQGKLWKFPINNEQGMEEEEKVHFSEHVFMDRHLKDWCPKRGPIRHFMELVCVGLSKNPYMTVEEKVGHITWYRDYFEDKKDLLNELGVLDDKAKEASEKKQIQS